jgi:hypothetical protein
MQSRLNRVRVVAGSPQEIYESLLLNDQNKFQHWDLNLEICRTPDFYQDEVSDQPLLRLWAGGGGLYSAANANFSNPISIQWSGINVGNTCIERFVNNCIAFAFSYFLEETTRMVQFQD